MNTTQLDEGEWKVTHIQTEKISSWNGPTVHVCCFMLACASTKTFVSRINIRQPSPKNSEKIFVSRKIRQQGHSLTEVSVYSLDSSSAVQSVCHNLTRQLTVPECRDVSCSETAQLLSSVLYEKCEAGQKKCTQADPLYGIAVQKTHSNYYLQFQTSLCVSVEEKKLVDEVFHNAMDVLSEEDRQLPQVENVLPLLRRGIGIHHGGRWNKTLLLFMVLHQICLIYHY